MNSLTHPIHRPLGYFKYMEPVVVIWFAPDSKHQVKVGTGIIVSTHVSHVDVDNLGNYFVWGDEPFNDAADSADDAYERAFDNNSPNLLKPDEAMALRHHSDLSKWFNGAYSEEVVAKIRTALLGMKDDDFKKGVTEMP